MQTIKDTEKNRTNEQTINKKAVYEKRLICYPLLVIGGNTTSRLAHAHARCAKSRPTEGTAQSQARPKAHRRHPSVTEPTKNKTTKPGKMVRRDNLSAQPTGHTRANAGQGKTHKKTRAHLRGRLLIYQ